MDDNQDIIGALLRQSEQDEVIEASMERAREENPDSLLSDLGIEHNDSEPLTPETLQEKLNNYRLAFQQEFEQAAQAQGAAKTTQEALDEASPHAVFSLMMLSRAAHSEMVRLSASKYIVDKVLATIKPEEDPWAKVLGQLMSKDQQNAIEASEIE